MKIGDIVTWTSQSAGLTKKKTGTILAVVPAGHDPAKIADAVDPIHPWSRFYYQLSGCFGNPRDHDSYLILVGPVIYWPRVSLLKLEDALFAKGQRTWEPAIHQTKN